MGSASVDFFFPSEQCGQISHLCTRALFPVCGSSTVTSIFKAFIGGLGAPSTCSTQELISRRWFYTDFSPQSLGFFGPVSSRPHSRTSPGVGLRCSHTDLGDPLLHLWVSPYCVQIPGYPFPCASGQNVRFLYRFSLQSEVARDGRERKKMRTLHHIFA